MMKANQLCFVLLITAGSIAFASKPEGCACSTGSEDNFIGAVHYASGIKRIYNKLGTNSR